MAVPATEAGSAPPLRLVGVDGCPSGWVAVGAETHRGCGASPFRDRPARLSFVVVPRFTDLLQTSLLKQADAVAVDIPIGLSEAGGRACDTLARKALPGRGSCVFSPPGRAVLAIPDYAAANARSRALCGKGLSRQSFFIGAKIAEVDAAMTPARQSRIVEGHPELCFARLAGEPVRVPKRRREGEVARLAILKDHGIDLTPLLADIRARFRQKDCARNDVIDAAVLLFAAHAAATGTPAPITAGEVDSTGLKIAIWR